MSLGQQIKDQYASRLGKESLYNSTYSQLAQHEKEIKLKSLLAEFVTINKSTTLLEIGAGQGGNIPMFFDLGFTGRNIFINEILPERVEAVRTNYPDVKVYEGDMLEVNVEEQFDIVFQSTVFTSILNDQDRKAMAEKLWSLVKPGGIVLWYDFVYNNPKNKYVRKVSVKEINYLFSKASKVRIQRLTLAPPIGRRVGKLYNLFNLPFLRSHILGAFQKQ